MIDTLSLLASLFAVGFVAVRASMLDKLLPWFKPAPEQPVRNDARSAKR